MNQKNNILEDLNRIHLLMNYNSKQTLTENESKLPKMAINESKLISEQKAVGQRIFGALLPGETAASAIAKKATATGAQKRVFDMLDDVARAVSMSGDDLITKLGSGAISGKKLSQVKQAFLLSTRGSTQFKDEILNLAVTGAKNNRGVSAAIARNASEAELVAAVKAMGYTDDAIATQIAKKLAPSATNQASKNMIQRFLSAGWEGIKNNWKTILAVVGASTALYYLYKYFNRKDITSLPMCIKKKAMEDEILEMANNGFDYINIGVIGNAEIDAMGGAKFWLDGNVVQLPNGDEGNWKVVGRRLTISAAGKTYDIECLDFDGGGGNTGGGGGVPIIPTPPSKYNNCINFPMAMYCSSDKIREVQNCLGITADGKFGPQTRNALKSSGYGDGTILTKQYYDAIMKNCGKEGSPNIPGPEDEFTPTFITPTEWLDQK